MDMSTYFLVFSLLPVAIVLCQTRFVTEPEDTSAIKGSTVVLKCAIEKIVGTVQWTRSGFGLGSNRELPVYPRYNFIGSVSLGEYDLMISNVQLEDDAVYECQVGATENTPGLRSRQAQVTVLLPPDLPDIRGGPKVRVVADEPYNLTCSADNGRPAANISWKVNGKALTEDTYYWSSTQADGKREDATGLLTILPRKADQSKQYTCEVMSIAMITPKTVKAMLEVLYPPEVTMTVTPSNNIMEYGNVVFTCEARGNPNVISWKWFKGDVEIAHAKSSGLTLNGITRDYHGKNIACQASNSVDSTRQSYTVLMKYGPQFTADPLHVAVDIGQDATLTCSVDGNPNPAIVWRRKGDEKLKILSSSSTLTLYNVQPGDIGPYTCQTSVMGYDPIYMDVHLMKKGPPKILSDTTQYAIFGEKGRVVCESNSIPKPKSVKWTKDGVPILPNALLNRYNFREESLATGVLSIVEILQVQDTDFGKFNCTVDNGYGHDSAVINFKRKDQVSLVYILIGVLAGVIIIIVIGVLIFLYHRRKSSESDTSSDNSEANLNKKKKDGSPEIKIEYKPDIYGNIENWKPELDQKFYRNSADYDELKYPPAQTTTGNNNFNRDLPDNYNYGYDRDYPRSTDYGTYPGPANNPRRYVDPRYDPTYGVAPPPSNMSDTYGTYRAQPRPTYAAGSDYGPLPGGGLPPPPPASVSSRLSTNV
jgi:hypothetical protein